MPAASIFANRIMRGNSHMMAFRRIAQFSLKVQLLPYIASRGYRSSSQRWQESETSKRDITQVDLQIRQPRWRKSQQTRQEAVAHETIEYLEDLRTDDFINESDSDELDKGMTIKARTAAIRDLLKNGKAVKPRHHYILDSKAAETLLRHLKPDLQETDVILETSPGLGILTETLLANTSNPILAYEPHSELRTYLEDTLLPLYPSQLQLHDLNLMKFFGYYIVSLKDGNSTLLNNLLAPLPDCDEQDCSPLKIVGVTYDTKFFTRLNLSFVLRCCFFESVSPVFYFFVPPAVFNMLTSTVYHRQKYSYTLGCQFRFYFNLEVLGSVPQDGFYPPINHKSQDSEDESDLWLVKVSQNNDIFTQVGQDEFEGFHYFIRKLLLSKQDETLITTLERWIPDCGPDFIKYGAHVFGHPRELSQEQLLLVYRLFTSLPAYPFSAFHHQKKQFMQKLTGHEDA